MNRVLISVLAGFLCCACSKSENVEEATGDQSGASPVVGEEAPKADTPAAQPADSSKAEKPSVANREGASGNLNANKDEVTAGDVKVKKDGVTTGDVKVDKDGVTTGGVKVDKDGVTTGGVKVGKDGKISVPGLR
ncbi:MAG TPA: hypothetical protein PLJ27_20880 [Polyangiaceae bacterium]|jgi:hypothetical protein|nr:MAG: hypothetical protein BWY17_00642 [Deltaproteobacteria bacterium ADurb.Bin207]HNZ24485.1 hypothetical protein [Polyangiaceae bacterium]HOD22912.1 hypothetical protein [Polyangiaceae bacterium]HOE50812.1 hypothetical protein [Polyangiaceae bacterium]HOH02534.1 hypothetical protein [Polyangiaceae bacterium]